MVQPNSFRCTCGAYRFLLVVLLFGTALLVSSDSCTSDEETRFCPGPTFTCSKSNATGEMIYECSDGQNVRDPDCDEDEGEKCSNLAYCVMPKGVAECACQPGLYGDGVGAADLMTGAGCSSESYAARLVINLDGSTAEYIDQGQFKPGQWWDTQRKAVADMFFDTSASEEAPAVTVASLYHEILQDTSIPQLTINVLFPDKTSARNGVQNFQNNVKPAEVTLFGVVINELRPGNSNEYRLDTDVAVWGPRVYKWVADTTSQSRVIPPAGMVVDSVSFDFACMSAGCWVVDITYTTGEDNWNVFYLPKVDNSPTDFTEGDPWTGPWYDSMAVDHNYNDIAQNSEFPWTKYQRPPGDTFFSNTFPCSSSRYQNNAATEQYIDGCCMIEFMEMYRPVRPFVTQFSEGEPEEGTTPKIMDLRDTCSTGDEVSFNRPGLTPVPGFHAIPSADTGYSMFGVFEGMELSDIKPIGLSYVDPELWQYRARLRLDELELRRWAGQLRGTVGVEHTVDTFIGLVNFAPTGSRALDSAASQTAIHLEKTSYFAVSTHGTNDYTFLEYVNMRVVEVLQADATLGETEAENSQRTNRTSRVDPAHYVQVTFTVGPQYEPRFAGTANAELIPLDSVRVGKGTNFEDEEVQDTVFHACVEYGSPQDVNNLEFDQDKVDMFDQRLGQTCAPQSTMCVNPRTLPDLFMSFNIPLGIGWLPEEAADLSENVFVELVVTADDKLAKQAGQNPNDGNAPWQTETRLFANIPVVVGGRQIFCDQIVAKTDLQDVVNATLVLGSASSESELSRLSIFSDIGQSVLNDRESLDFGETASIEAGLMTLVLTGEPSYFGLTEGGMDGAGNFGVQLEDVITVHLMEQDPDFDADGTVSKEVKALLAAPGQDNFDSLASNAELRTRGYHLNGAFRFMVDRASGVAELQPTDELLAWCPFNPPRPSDNDPFPATCVTRRDVHGRNNYPVRTGATWPTATEVASLNSDVAGNRAWMGTVVGASNAGADLGEDFGRVIATRWSLNDRYNRAYWINPSYEWTPTQIGGQNVNPFRLSQKLFVFALVALDENLGSGSRRRQLLSGSVDTGTGVSSTSVGFRTDPTTLVADLLGVPQEQVTKWQIKYQLTRELACMDRGEMRAIVRDRLEAAFKASASNVRSVQVVYVVVDMADESCLGVVVRRATEQESSAVAEVDVLVAFSESEAKINPDTLSAQPGIKGYDGVGLPLTVLIDATWDLPDGAYEDDDEEEDSPLGLSWTAIYGICGAVGGVLLLLLIFGVRYCHRGRCAKLREAQEAEIVTVMYLRDVKADLADDMFGEGQEGADEKTLAQNEFEFNGNGNGNGHRRGSDDFENAFSSPSKESRGDIF